MKTSTPHTHNQTGGRQLLVFAVMLLLSATAFAQNTWTNTAGGDWSAGTNWLQGAAPDAVDAIADFSQAGILSPTTVHLDTPQTVGTLIFGNATPENWTLDNNGNQENFLTLATSSGLPPSIIVTNLVAISATLAGDEGLAIGGSGAGTLVLASGAYSGLTTISNETVVVTATNILSPNDLWFGGSAVSNGSAAVLYIEESQTVSNLVTSGTSVAASSGSTTAATIVITNGQTLTVQGSALFGYLNSSTIFTNNVMFTGGGSFVQQLSPEAGSDTPLSFQVGACNLTSGQSGPRATVDMSGLASATINLGTNNTAGGVYYPTGVGSVAQSTAGSLIVGDAMKNNAGGELCSLLLASNTTVTANMLTVGFERVQGVVETLVLGAGSNVFNVNTNGLACPPGFSGREGGRMFFNTPTGSLKIRAQDGVSRSTLYIGASQTGSGGVTLNGLPALPGGYGGLISPQYADLSGHYADLLLSTLNIGDEKRGIANYPFELWTNYFTFDTGVLNTTGLRLGITTGTAEGTNYFQNVCNLNGGTVVIGVNGITNASLPNPASGTVGYLYTNDTYLNIGGSTVTVNGNIMAGFQNSTNENSYLLSTITITSGSLTVTGNVYCARTGTIVTFAPIASRVVTLTLNGGTLDMTGHPIGSNPFGSTVTNNYLDVLNFWSGTLQNVSQLNNGTVPMVKNGPGTLTLSGVNSYTGGTVVSNGTLIVNHDSALGSNNVTVASGATLELTGGMANQYNSPAASLIIAPGANPVNLAYTGSDQVSGLSFDGGMTFQSSGTWGSSASGATHQDNTHFSGTGIIVVATPSSVVVSSSASSAVITQPVILTATVTGASGTPTGTVTFSSGNTVLGTATLTGGTASITNSTLAAGTNSIVASYSGDSTYGAAVSTAFAQVITAPVIAVIGSNLLLDYPNSLIGTSYVLLSTTNLDSPIAWTPVQTNAGTGGTLTFTLPYSVSTPQQFFLYQLELQ